MMNTLHILETPCDTLFEYGLLGAKVHDQLLHPHLDKAAVFDAFDTCLPDDPLSVASSTDSESMEYNAPSVASFQDSLSEDFSETLFTPDVDLFPEFEETKFMPTHSKFVKTEMQKKTSYVPSVGASLDQSRSRLTDIKSIKKDVEGRMIGGYTPAQRAERLARFRMKRLRRQWGKKIKYFDRKRQAEGQKRVRGRFARAVSAM